MSSILRAIIDQHVWANDTLFGFCETLTPEQLGLTGPGTFGPVHDTLVHLADAEVIYLSRIPDSGISLEFDEESDTLPQVSVLRASLQRTGEAWHRVVEQWPDDLAFAYVRGNGDEEQGSVSFSIVQMLDHGAEHRNHVRTILSSHGIEPPEIDGWTWNDERQPENR